MNTLEKRQKRAKLINDARAILDAAEKENRDLTQEEQNQWNKLMDEAKRLGEQIDREERQAAMDATLGQPLNQPIKPELDGGRENGEKKELREAFKRYLRSGPNALSGDEIRALQADADVSGGFIVAPQQFGAQLMKAVDDQVFMRQLGTVIPLDRAESLGIPSLDADPADADWTTELATGSEDTTMAFGKRELTPHPMAKRIKVSNKLLRQAAIDVESLVTARLAYKIGITQEKGFLTGDGAGKALGIFTASAQGISTSRDVSTDNTTTSITHDGILNAKYALKPQYWAKARWLFHPDAVKQISKLKDGEGQYLWSASTQTGQPDRLQSFPVLMSQYVPNTFTAGLYVGMLADFSFYWIVDALNIQMQRLIELYAETNQVGFIARYEGDGMPVLEEAFVRVTLAP